MGFGGAASQLWVTDNSPTSNPSFLLIQMYCSKWDPNLNGRAEDLMSGTLSTGIQWSFLCLWKTNMLVHVSSNSLKQIKHIEPDSKWIPQISSKYNYSSSPAIKKINSTKTNAWNICHFYIFYDDFVLINILFNHIFLTDIFSISHLQKIII